MMRQLSPTLKVRLTLEGRFSSWLILSHRHLARASESHPACRCPRSVDTRRYRLYYYGLGRLPRPPKGGQKKSHKIRSIASLEDDPARDSHRHLEVAET